MSLEKYDVLVLGSGPAGGIVARKCSKEGLKVAVVEESGWGGVCPLRGCEPKKVLVDAAHAVARLSDMAGNGPEGGATIDWSKLMRFKRSLIDPIPELVLNSFEKHDITTISGTARFEGKDTVSVEGHGSVQADKIVVAVGARARHPEVPGAELLLSSRDFFEVDELPGSLVFIGGGFISLEFAAVAAAAGAKVTVVQRSERVLRGFDLELSKTLIKALEAHGVKVVLNHPLVRVERDNGGIVVVAEDETGAEVRFPAGMGVVGAGRIPNTDRLNLDAAGVEWSKHGVKVNKFMQSVSNPHVYAAGDCAEEGVALTPTAALQGETVAHNIINGNEDASDLTGTASVVFTHPPLMRVGMLEEEARDQGLEFKVHEGDASRWSEHERLGLEHAGYRILEETSTGRILGAHYLGQHAEEVSNIFGLAIRHGLTRETLLAQPWAYPSFGYTLRYML